jgi:signal transduction histidine kinase
VVRALAEAHGGSARLENRVGGGARAVLRLPVDSAVKASVHTRRPVEAAE